MATLHALHIFAYWMPHHAICCCSIVERCAKLGQLADPIAPIANCHRHGSLLPLFEMTRKSGHGIAYTICLLLLFDRQMISSWCVCSLLVSQCFMFHVPCTMYHVPCSMFHAICPKLSVLAVTSFLQPLHLHILQLLLLLLLLLNSFLFMFCCCAAHLFNLFLLLGRCLWGFGQLSLY